MKIFKAYQRVKLIRVYRIVIKVIVEIIDIPTICGQQFLRILMKELINNSVGGGVSWLSFNPANPAAKKGIREFALVAAKGPAGANLGGPFVGGGSFVYSAHGIEKGEL